MSTPKALYGGGSAAVGSVTAISPLSKEKESDLPAPAFGFSVCSHTSYMAANVGPKAQ